MLSEAEASSCKSMNVENQKKICRLQESRSLSEAETNVCVPETNVYAAETKPIPHFDTLILTVCDDKCTSFRKYASPMTSAQVARINKIPISQLRGMTSITSMKRDTITRQ